MSSYSGYMLANQAGDSFSVTDIEQAKAEVAGGPLLVHKHIAFGIPRWGEYVLYSPVPLADEPDHDRPSYGYQLFVVRGHSKLIILASRRRIVDYALNQILDRRIFPSLRKISIYVEQVIEHCTRPESQFLVTSLHGRFSGSSRNVRSMSLYGDDVTNTSIYREHHDFFNFHSCGIGRRLFDGLPRLRPNEEGEIVRISHDGFLNLNLSTRREAQELIRVVDFIVQNRWVEDWVPRREEKP
jgi:hypothetical protein